MLDQLLGNFVSLDIGELRPGGFYKAFSEAKKRDVRIVEKGSGWERRNACPICGSGSRSQEFECFGVPIVRCGACTHRYVEKVPSNLNEVYDSQSYSQAVQELELSQQEYRKTRFGGERAAIVQGLFKSTRKRILDVGCGWGYFLAALKDQGFDCYGIELSRPMADMCRKTYGLNVASVPIEDYLPRMRFDLISLFGVVEHVKEPVSIIRKCGALLRKGGFVLIFTPNFESVAVKIQGPDANMIYPAQHLHHFTRKSMEKLAGLAGMKMHSYCTKGLDMGDIYAYEKQRGNGKAASFLLANATVLQAVIDASDCANHMRVVLRK